jgi:ParB-like chromosome segregation protein Spo0J
MATKRKYWWSAEVKRIKKIPLEERRKMAVDLDPFSIVRITIEKAVESSGTYPGGLYGKKFQNLIASIKKNGILCPVYVCPTTEDPTKYSVMFGRHRVVACQFLNIKVKAHILNMPEQRR